MSSWRDRPIVDEETGGRTTFGDEVRRLRELASGNPPEAFELWLELAMSLHWAHVNDGAAEALAELREAIASNDVADDRWPWLLNAEGMVFSDLGRQEDARKAYEEMQRLGSTLTDQEWRDDLVSTAQQNLGIVLIDDEPENAVELLRKSLTTKCERDDLESALDVLMSLGVALVALERLDEANDIYGRLIEAAAKTGHVRLEGAAWGNRGTLLVKQHDLAAAQEAFERALALFREDEDPGREVLGLQSLGTLHAQRERPDEAIAFYEQALSLASDLGSATLELRIRRSLAWLLVTRQQWERAQTELETASQLAQALGHRGAEADVLADLGALRVEQGSMAEGEALLDRAAAILKELGDDVRLVDVLRNQAELSLRRQDGRRAEELLSQAEQLLGRRSSDPHRDAQRANLLRRRAEVLLGLGESEQAAHSFAQELVVLRATGPALTAAWQAATAGTLLSQTGDPALALPLLQDALAAYEQAADRRLASRVRNDTALALAALGRLVEARELLNRSLSEAEALEDRALRLRTLLSLGELRDREGDAEGAITMLREAVELATALDDRDVLGYAAGHLALILVDTGRTSEARTTLEALEAITGEPGGAPSEGVIVGAKAALAFADGDYAEAAEQYGRAAELDRRESPRGEVESLGGLLESLVAMGTSEEQLVQGSAQELVTLAQRSGNEDVARTALARAGGRAYRRRDANLAVALWETALRLALITAQSDDLDPDVLDRARRVLQSHTGGDELTTDESEFIVRVFLGLLQVVPLIEDVLQEISDEAQREELWRSLGDALAEQFGDAGDQARSYLEMARNQSGGGADAKLGPPGETS